MKCFKKIIMAIFSLGLVIIFLIPINSQADSVGDEIYGQVEDILTENEIGWSVGDISGMNFGEITAALFGSFKSRLTAPLRLLSTVLAVIIFSSAVKSFGSGVLNDGSGDGLGIVSVLAAVTVIVPQLLTVYSSALDSVERTGGFIAVYVPVFTGISISCGSFSTAGTYNVMTLAASELFVQAADHYLMPVLSLTAVLAAAGSIFPDASLESIVSLIKKTVITLLTITMTLFTGFVTLKCSVTGKADSAAAKAVKTIISGTVPIVGGAVSDAYGTVKGSFAVIQSTVGWAGVIAVAVILLPKIIELFIYKWIMWAGACAADIFTAKEISKLLKAFESGISIALSLMICYGLMFVLCSAVLMKTMV